MKKKTLIIICSAVLVVGIIIAAVIIFNKEKPATPQPVPPGQQTEPDRDEPGTKVTPPVDYGDEEDKFTFTDEMGDLMFSHNQYFYEEGIYVRIYSRNGGTIRYTVNGETPTEKSNAYAPGKGIFLAASTTDDPKVHTIHAKAFYEDGTASDELVHSYLIGRGVTSRYENLLIFCISGNPADLTGSPNGIFFGNNYELRGKKSERPVYVEVLNRSGEKITEQKLGVRINGGYNRQFSQKSMKFFARKSYSPNEGTTYLNCFNLLAEDGSQIVRYDKFVLRASGNDFRFAFVRDELNQMLAADAGFSDYEPVFPAVAYMNGQYFGFYWLHGAYCDEFFKNRYGDSPARKAANGEKCDEGEFIVLAGTDTEKELDEEDEDEAKIAEEFNKTYEEFSKKDLRNEAEYRKLRAWMDVENYLDYMAYNIYLCNQDWPNNNVRCYRYYPTAGESFGEAPYDGRWRYLLHDIDYTYGLYGQQEVLNSYDTLKQVLSSPGPRRSPLFAALMERADCREYFIRKSLDYGAGALSYGNVCAKLDAAIRGREKEMDYYYAYLTSLGKPDVSWVRKNQYASNLQSIRDFAERRADRSADYLKFNLNLKGEKYWINAVGSQGAKLVIGSFTAKEGAGVNGVYFTDYAVKVSAEYKLGKAFDYWEVNGNKVTTETLSITKASLKDGRVSIALHVKDVPVGKVLISEFCARDDDSVVLTNYSTSDISLKGYILSDGTYDYPFEDGDVIKAGDSIVIYGNNTDTDAASERKAIFNLSEGETIVLKNATGAIVDSAYVPNPHTGFYFKRNLFTMKFEEVPQGKDN